jgi:hypothetical protein
MKTLKAKQQELKILSEKVAELRKEVEKEESDISIVEDKKKLTEAVNFLNKKRSDGLTNLEFLKECKKPRKLVNHPILRNMKMGYYYSGFEVRVYGEKVELHKKFSGLLDNALYAEDIDLDTLYDLSKAFDFPEYKEMYTIISKLNEIIEELDDFDGTLERLFNN